MMASTVGDGCFFAALGVGRRERDGWSCEVFFVGMSCVQQNSTRGKLENELLNGFLVTTNVVLRPWKLHIVLERMHACMHQNPVCVQRGAGCWMSAVSMDRPLPLGTIQAG